MSKDDSIAEDNAGTRRKSILEAARALFLKSGFDKGGLREVAQMAGFTKSAIYLDFPSKEALLDALVREESMHFARQLFSDLEAGPARFGVIFSRAVELLDAAPFVKGLLVGDSALLGSYVRRHRKRFLAARSHLNRAFLDVMHDRGRLREDISRDAAEELMLMITVGYVDTPVDDQRSPELFAEMGRLLDRWLLKDGDGERFKSGELTAILRDVMNSISTRGGNDHV